MDFNVFPNPATNFISFTGFSDEKNIHYAIVNTSGETISEGDSFNHSINIMDIARGMYYLTIQSDEKKATKHFLKD